MALANEMVPDAVSEGWTYAKRDLKSNKNPWLALRARIVFQQINAINTYQ